MGHISFIFTLYREVEAFVVNNGRMNLPPLVLWLKINDDNTQTRDHTMELQHKR